MTDRELLNNIIGFWAYESGCTDSGMKNDTLKEECQRIVDSRRDDKSLEKLFASYVHELTEPDSQYTLEDVARFIAYLADEFDWDCR
jgi:hypothetical protein